MLSIQGALILVVVVLIGNETLEWLLLAGFAISALHLAYLSLRIRRERRRGPAA